MTASRKLRVLVAADKFKGSLSGPQACAAIAAGLRDALGDHIDIRCAPVADGGEGMARGITEARDGEWIEVTVSDPLGRPVEAGFGIIGGGGGERVGVLEMAEASGLWRLTDGERDPWRASTRGTGELMRAALARGIDRLLLGIGGSATNDGGGGMAAALGFRFLDHAGNAVADLPARLGDVVRIEAPGHAPPPPVVVACDVTNLLLGPAGCTRVYGPQKGVAATEFERHEARLAHLVGLTGERGAAAAKKPGAGAAGGLGFGCLVFTDAALRPGFELVAEVLGLEPAIRQADVVITGEGRLDSQTLQGKAPAGVAALAHRHGKPVAALAGVIDSGAETALGNTFDFFAALATGDLAVEESMRRAAPLLRETARRHAGAIAALT